MPKAERDVELKGGYETKRSSSFQFEFKGPIEDAEPLKEFLEAQFRGAGDTDLHTQFELRFEGGLDLTSDAPEKLTERLARFASGAAYVTAEAESEKVSVA